MKSLKLMSRHKHISTSIFHKNADFAKHADRRLKFEEAFFFQLVTVSKKLQQSFTIGNFSDGRRKFQ